MKILLINEYFPPVAPGGAEWSVYYLAQALVQGGHAVGLATIRHGPPPQVPKGVQVFAMPFPFHLPEGQKMHRQGVLENPLVHAAFALFLTRVSRAFQPDLFHAQSKNALVAGTVASKLLGIPLVYTLRDVGITCPFGMCFVNGSDVEACSLKTCMGSCSRFLAEHYSPRRVWDSIKIRLLALALWPDTLLKQACMRLVTERISPSVGLLRALPRRLGQNCLSWTIIPHLPPLNGEAALPKTSEIPSTAFAARKPIPKPYVLYMGKISLGKGIHVLEGAIRQVAPEFPEVSFLVAGKGQWTPPRDLPIEHLGSIDHPTALDLMRGSECVVVPSVVPEAFNRVVLEAMSVGRPVIASDSGSLPEQVQNEVTGLVVPRGSTQALARALRQLLADASLRERLGEQGQRWVQTAFSAGKSLRDTEAIYERCASQTGSPRWALLNFPIRLWLQGVIAFNDRAKRLAMHLVRWTGKSRQKIHPKNLLEDEETYAWYGPFLQAEDRVLDVGAGHGTHTLIAASRCKEAVGVEYDPGNLATCLQRVQKRHLDNVRFMKGNVEEHLPFPDHSFDAVLLLDVLEHLHKRDQALREIHRVLKHGGRLLLAIPNRQTSWKNRLRRAGLFYYSDRDHKVEYSLAEITEELKRNGFHFQDRPQTVVWDTPWVGLMDLVGGISLRIYRKLMLWKVRYAQEHPEESIGWQIVAVPHL